MTSDDDDDDDDDVTLPIRSHKKSDQTNEMASTEKSAGPILVTGGAGYIGSHTILLLLEQGYDVVVVDNLVNASMVSLDRVAELAGLDEIARKERLVYHNVDMCDRDALKNIFESSPTFSACIHFAGLKVKEQIVLQKNFKLHTLTFHSFSHCSFLSLLTRPLENRQKFR